MQHGCVLETDRLVLRPLTVDDAEAAFCWVGDPEVARYMRYVPYRDVEQVKRWLRSLEKHEEFYEFAYVRKADGLLVGSGGGSPNDAGDGWKVGYNLRKDCWGQGYATEALKAILEFAHQELGIRVFTADHAVENPASGRVMEKCGMVFVGRDQCEKREGSGNLQLKCYRLELE